MRLLHLFAAREQTHSGAGEPRHDTGESRRATRLHGRDARRQHEAGVVAVHHDAHADAAGGEPPAVLPRQRAPAVGVLELDPEHLREVLLCVFDSLFDSNAGECCAESVSSQLSTPTAKTPSPKLAFAASLSSQRNPTRAHRDTGAAKAREEATSASPPVQASPSSPPSAPGRGSATSPPGCPCPCSARTPQRWWCRGRRRTSPSRT